MSRILLTAALLALSPAAARALPVNPLPDASAFDRRPASIDLLAETSRGCSVSLERCASARALMIDGRFETPDARSVDLAAARERLLAAKGFLLADVDPDDVAFTALEEEIVETPLPAAAFPMLLGLAGAALALRLKRV